VAAAGRRRVNTFQQHQGKVSLGQYARRQVLEDLARCAVVIDRVCWTAGNGDQVRPGRPSNAVTLCAGMVRTVVPVRNLGCRRE
jgi:hypothetical protein